MKKLAKIIVPVVLIVLIAGVWAVKNKDSKAEISEKVKKTTENAKDINTSSESIENKTEEDNLKNIDFELDVTEQIDIEKLKSYGVPIVIDFGADKCIACKELAPVLEELNKELRGKAIIKFVDIWKYKELAEGYPIEIIPTQIFYDSKGKPFVPKNAETMKLILNQEPTTKEHVFTSHMGGLTKAELMDILREMGLKD